MPSTINNRRDILLLLLYSPGLREAVNEPIIGRTRLVKMLFLFKEEALEHFRRATEIDRENFYQFFPWDFGPFSSQVYDDLTFFILRGFIETDATEEEPLPESAAEWEKWIEGQDASDDDDVQSYEEVEFKLTEKGVRFTDSLYGLLNNGQKQLLKTFKARLINVPLRAVLKYVYSTYGDMTTKSKIKDHVLGTGG